jgi:NAD(P)-dependent dehydrogenase (short-subunit alcohol dehydrogenase family)
VTGANRGIGAAIATELASRGFSVACLTRSGAVPELTARIHQRVANRLVGLHCDVTDTQSIATAFAAIAELPDELCGVVNCAGIISGGPSHEFDITEFEAILQTNVTGTFKVCQAAYPALARRGSGLIVNIGSFWDQMGVKWYAAYCASKAAVGALTRCLGVEWAKKGIRVIDVAPGYIETEMTSAGLNSEATRKFLESRLPGGRVGRPRSARIRTVFSVRPV